MVGTILTIVLVVALLAWLGHYVPPSRTAHPFEHERYRAEVKKRQEKRRERNEKFYGRWGGW